jgi:hypothetical protein
MKRFQLAILIAIALGALAFAPAPQTPAPKRITFAPGAISAMVTGALPMNGTDEWVIRVQGTQTMHVNLGIWNGRARLIIWGADGTVLISDHADAPYWSGTVPSTQDYHIKVNAYDNTAPNYTMDVTIPPLDPNPPSPTTCTNKAAFVADITVPDGTPWQPNQGFNKIWRVQNIGTCAWNTGYQLAFVGGEQMTTLTHLTVPRTIAPGQTLDLLIAMNAPSAFGAHSGRWQLRDGAGVFFGPVLTVKINTINPAMPTQVAIISPGNGFQFSAGATVRVTFQAVGSTELTSVALYMNGALVAKQSSRTPTRTIIGAYEWQPTPGSYDFYAVATDLSGQATASAHVAGSIVDPVPHCQASGNFRADRSSINVGEHVMLRWDVECVRAIYFEGQGVTGHEARDVQPHATTTYTLSATKNDGTTESRTVTIAVNQSPAPPPPPQRRNINGHWVVSDYLLELTEAIGCSSVECPIAGRVIHATQVVDVSGTFNVFSGAVAFTAQMPNGPSFSGTVDASSRTMTGTLSGMGTVTLTKQ